MKVVLVATPKEWVHLSPPPFVCVADAETGDNVAVAMVEQKGRQQRFLAIRVRDGVTATEPVDWGQWLPPGRVAELRDRGVLAEAVNRATMDALRKLLRRLGMELEPEETK